jgi:LuxR family maltose regulon positive regulatory protein
MALTLLSTKLSLPPRPRALVPRPRLVARLEEGLEARMILISAPAGFGKTTLLAEWLHGREGKPPLPVAWLSLDHEDDDPTRFLAYLVAALQTLAPRLGDGLLPALRSPQPPPPESLLAVLVNDAAALLEQGRYLLVLDDYHIIQAPAIHRVLSFLLDHLPPSLELVVAGRADPPIPLARLRGQGQLVDLRDADLRFTPEEAAAFLNKIMGLALSAGDVAALGNRTEGWVTGLQLAALSLRGRSADEVPAFVQDFAGSHRFVLDYLVEEVLQQQSPGIQATLLQTSILDRLCGLLCEAVVGDWAAKNSDLARIGDGDRVGGRAWGQAALEYLEANHLFIVPLDDERRWYRYHRLFADLLRARLPHLGPHLGCPPPAELHRRASTWFQAEGLRDQAIAHALAAGDGERAADLVTEVGLTLLVQGELATLLAWLRAVPDELVRARPWLCIYHAWALALSGQEQAAEARLQAAAAGAEYSGTGEAGGHIAAIRAYMAAHAGDVPRAVALARRALDLLPAEERTVRSVVAFTLAGVHRVQGDLEAAGQALAEASTMGQEGGNLHLAVSALCQRANLEAEQGRLHDAARLHRRALELAGDLPVAASAYSGLGSLFYEWNDLPTAQEHLNHALALHRRWGNTEAMAADYGDVLRLQLAQGDLEKATAVLDELARLMERPSFGPPSSFLTTWAEIYGVYLALARGDLRAAARWATRPETQPQLLQERVYLGEFRNLTLARVYLALGREHARGEFLAQAEELLSPMLAVAEAQGRRGQAIGILVLLALVHQAAGETEQALALLEPALAQAEPEGYVRTFVDGGPPLAELLRALAARGKGTTYATRLLAAFPGADAGLSPPARYAPREQPLVEPLSDRELEVLRLVAAGLTNREVGETLFIEVSTVKSHTNSIYGKLGVKNRTQAVARAQELGLV